MSEVESKAAHQLQFGSTESVSEVLTNELKIVFTNSEDWASKLVNANVHVDIQLYIQYALASQKSNAVYFYESENKLNVVCIKEGKLHLANTYAIENNDDLFYFIMLVVEQLNLEPATLHIETICSKGKHEDYLVLFKNYLPAIRLTDSKAIMHNPVSAQYVVPMFLAECVL